MGYTWDNFDDGGLDLHLMGGRISRWGILGAVDGAEVFYQGLNLYARAIGGFGRGKEDFFAKRQSENLGKAAALLAQMANKRPALANVTNQRHGYENGSRSSTNLMEIEANEYQPKQERLRTRWTASLDKIFADLVVEQIQLGNKRNNVFDKKTWNHIRDEFNIQTDLSFNNNKLRKHVDVLRTRYYNLNSSFDSNDFAMDDSCCIGFDLWDIGPKPETTKIKDCPIFEQLCTIFADLGADGK